MWEEENGEYIYGKQISKQKKKSLEETAKASKQGAEPQRLGHINREEGEEGDISSVKARNQISDEMARKRHQHGISNVIRNVRQAI